MIRIDQIQWKKNEKKSTICKIHTVYCGYRVNKERQGYSKGAKNLSTIKKKLGVV